MNPIPQKFTENNKITRVESTYLREQIRRFKDIRDAYWEENPNLKIRSNPDNKKDPIDVHAAKKKTHVQREDQIIRFCDFVLRHIRHREASLQGVDQKTVDDFIRAELMSSD